MFSQIGGFGDEHPFGCRLSTMFKADNDITVYGSSKTTSYDTDNTPNLIVILNQVTIIQEHDDIHLLSIDLPTHETMNSEHEESKIIYELAGWVCFKLLATVEGCKIFMSFLSSNNSVHHQV